MLWSYEFIYIYFYHKFKLKFRRFPERGNLIFWNHFYSWGPMFAEYQHIAYSFGTYFVGNWFDVLQCMMIHKLFKCLWGCKFMGKCNLCPRNPRTLIPSEQWWFHSIYHTSRAWPISVLRCFSVGPWAWWHWPGSAGFLSTSGCPWRHHRVPFVKSRHIKYIDTPK